MWSIVFRFAVASTIVLLGFGFIAYLADHFTQD